ncbi:MAG TPA: creatininase family protein [Terriglobia bacterium]|nr:creatininase family protein [Terriglobia bacterium]
MTLKRNWVSTLAIVILAASAAGAQTLPVKWEELTAADFAKSIAQAQGTCVLPIGVIEKHGPHLPLGNDLLNVRFLGVKAAESEYAVVFPEYYFGQIFEAKQEPGTVAYSAELQLELLQETADEMARNGCKKIIILNGHGGNNSLLPYFAQTQLASPRDYVVFVYQPSLNVPGRPSVTDRVNMHAGETETAHSMIARPDLVHLDRAKEESGADQNRLQLPEGVYTAIWWYAKFPDHYAGDGSLATRELGEFDHKTAVRKVAEVIRAVKADQQALKVQKEFYEKTSHPLDTKQ